MYMNCKLLLSAAFISASLMATAQDGAKSYAITGKANNTFSGPTSNRLIWPQVKW